MEKVKIAFVGTGGYGNYLLGLLEKEVDHDLYDLRAVIDPFVKSAPRYQWFVENHIPMYDTLEDFYAHDTAELVFIATPIHLHKQQCITAMRHGSHVMCEKPLVPLVQDVYDLKKVSQETGRFLGVGFQWSFYPSILAIKEDFLSGKLGKPKMLKSYIAWQRFDSYYGRNGWSAHIRSKNGDWVLDSIVTNATAHYLHNIFFMMGDTLAGSRLPSVVKTAMYRAKDIESFDTCVAGGEFDNGARFIYLASHSTEINRDPVIEYEFENAVVRGDMNQKDSHLVATFRDGSTKDYGLVNGDSYTAVKLITALKAVRGEAQLTSDPDSILPHLIVCDAMLDQDDIHDFPKDLVYRVEGDNPGTFVHGLYDDLRRCFDDGKLPSEEGFSWAFPEKQLDVADYREFKGTKFQK